MKLTKEELDELLKFKDKPDNDNIRFKNIIKEKLLAFYTLMPTVILTHVTPPFLATSTECVYLALVDTESQN